MFRMVAFLGKGWFGTVHRALSPSGDSFAVKSTTFNTSSSLHMEQRIYAEFVDCPEIVQCYCGYSSTEDGTHLYNLALEYANEGSLRMMMSQLPGRRLPVDQVKEFTRMILRGLSEIHEFKRKKGLQNSQARQHLGVQDGVGREATQVGGFGAGHGARNRRETVSASLPGDPWYMSPESVIFGELGPRLDIWLLGCVVIEMITGYPAYGAILDRDELARKLRTLQKAPDIPRTCACGEKLLALCLAIDPEERWSATELLLHPFLA